MAVQHLGPPGLGLTDRSVLQVRMRMPPTGGQTGFNRVPNRPQAVVINEAIALAGLRQPINDCEFLDPAPSNHSAKAVGQRVQRVVSVATTGSLKLDDGIVECSRRKGTLPVAGQIQGLSRASFVIASALADDIGKPAGKDGDSATRESLGQVRATLGGSIPGSVGTNCTRADNISTCPTNIDTVGE